MQAERPSEAGTHSAIESHQHTEGSQYQSGVIRAPRSLSKISTSLLMKLEER